MKSLESRAVIFTVAIKLIRRGGLQREPEGPGFAVGNVASEVGARGVCCRHTSVADGVQQKRTSFDESNQS